MRAPTRGRPSAGSRLRGWHPPRLNAERSLLVQAEKGIFPQPRRFAPFMRASAPPEHWRAAPQPWAPLGWPLLPWTPWLPLPEAVESSSSDGDGAGRPEYEPSPRGPSVRGMHGMSTDDGAATGALTLETCASLLTDDVSPWRDRQRRSLGEDFVAGETPACWGPDASAFFDSVWGGDSCSERQWMIGAEQDLMFTSPGFSADAPVLLGEDWDQVDHCLSALGKTRADVPNLDQVPLTSHTRPRNTRMPLRHTCMPLSPVCERGRCADCVGCQQVARLPP